MLRGSGFTCQSHQLPKGIKTSLAPYMVSGCRITQLQHSQGESQVRSACSAINLSVKISMTSVPVGQSTALSSAPSVSPLRRQRVLTFPLGTEGFPFLFLHERELGLPQDTEWHCLWCAVESAVFLKSSVWRQELQPNQEPPPASSPKWACFSSEWELPLREVRGAVVAREAAQQVK